MKLLLLLNKLSLLFLVFTSILNAQEESLLLDGAWEFKAVSADKWMPAEVPGVVHLDLLNNNVIEDPFYRMNESKVQWIGKEKWEYKRNFEVSESLFNKSQIKLFCDGLDTFASVYINDQLVATTNNMHLRYQFDCKPYVKKGSNTIKVVFDSYLERGLELHEASPYPIPGQGNDKSTFKELKDIHIGTYIRKAGYQFGWDWGPRFLTSGIWRSIYIEGNNVTNIQSVYFKPVGISKKKANYDIELELDHITDKTITAQVKVNGKTKVESDIVLNKKTKAYKIPLSIKKPKFWWPNGMGEANLYDIEVNLFEGDNLIASHKERLGVRTIELVTDPDEQGASFYFKVNGVPFFAKGANYIPSDNFLTRVDKERYLQTIMSSKRSHFNMLRVWGGGIYESDLFYELCDAHGILVWQDFMFACSFYPGDDAFVENVKQEAIDNVKRLRNHASIALWCGNNEIETAWRNWGAGGWQATNDPRNWDAYVKVFHETLPEVVATYQPEIRYWRSSPTSDDDSLSPQDIYVGDAHYWGYRAKRLPISEFKAKENIPRFMSETGFQSFPELESVKKFSIPSDWELFSPVMKQHQKSAIGNALIADYIVRHYNTPKDFEGVIYQGQLMQSKSMRVAHEAYLRAMPFCMGALYWQINDCWPVASWSTIDYYGKWKAQQYEMKRMFAPVFVAPETTTDSLTVQVISHEIDKIKGQLEVSIHKLDGSVIYETSIPKTLKPNDNVMVFNKDLVPLLNGISKSEVYIKAQFVSKRNILSKNIHLMVPEKDLPLQKPNITIKSQKVKSGFKLTVTSDTYAKALFLRAEGVAGFFTDNYFDVTPEQPVSLIFETKIEVDDIVGKLKTYSLYDSSEH